MMCSMFRNRLMRGFAKAVPRRAASTEAVESAAGEWSEKVREDVYILKGKSATVQ